jgi:hypothetical protein
MSITIRVRDPNTEVLKGAKQNPNKLAEHVHHNQGRFKSFQDPKAVFDAGLQGTENCGDMCVYVRHFVT